MLVAMVVVMAVLVTMIVAMVVLVCVIVLMRVFVWIRMPMTAARWVTERSLVWRCARHGGFPCLFLLTAHLRP